MISKNNLELQLKHIRFNPGGWGRSEVSELCNVLMPEEEIDECVNGFYEAGFALLVATRERLILVDKKPLSFLTIEDLRFDMINEFDFNHRFIGAEVKISAGMKTLLFTSWNASRLRRLLGFVQYRITEVKKQQQVRQEAQQAHLAHLDRQIQLFLAIQQYQYQQMTGQQPAGVAPSVASPVTTLMGIAGAGLNAGHHLPQLSPGQISMAAMKRVVPVISAYTRVPWMSRRFSGIASA